MKKSVMRMFSVLLALVMLLGMTATAEVTRITFDLNGFDGTKLDGILSIGYDEDGCEQYSFVNSMLGKFVLQSDGNDLVFGADQMGYYAISAEDLTEAINIIISSAVYGQAGDEFTDMMNYFNSYAYQQDIQVVSELLANEVNRIASIAAQMGLVAIYENGDLEISANVEKIFALIGAYLESLSEDTDVLNAFADLGIFPVLDIPMAEYASELPVILKDAADQVKAAADEIKEQMDGGLELYVSAETGVMTGKYYTKAMYMGEVVNSMTETFTFSDGALEMETVTVVNGGEIREAFMVSENAFSYELSAEAEGQSARAAINLDQNGIVAEAVADTKEISGEGKIVVNANGIDGKWDFAGDNANFNGNIDFDPASENFNFKVNYANRYESFKANVEIEDGELYATMTKVADGKVLADFTISGSGIYRIKGTWVAGYNSNALDATLRVTNTGVKLEGDLQVGSSGSYTFFYENNTADKRITYFIAFVDGTRRDSLEINLYSTAYGNRVSVSAVSKNDYESMTVSAAAETNMATGVVSGEFAFDNGYNRQAGVFSIGEDGLEIKFSDSEMTYRIYAEGEATATGTAIKAGLSGAQNSEPENVMDAILFILNLNNDMTFEALLNTMMGYYAEASFNGQAFKLDVTANGETFTFEGKPVATDNAQYLEFTGSVSGMPFEARIGMKAEAGTEMCLFAEAFVDYEKALDVEVHLIENGNEIAVEVLGDSLSIEGEKVVVKAGVIIESNETVRFFGEVTGEDPSHKVGAYLPITYIANENGQSVSASLTLSQAGETMEVGNVLASYETVNESLDHIDGERLTADMLVEMIMSMLGAY
ncbi:MAG: hypothetical protein IKJ65_10810 [Clostridia bacterium]|nr:hypothetical protein [Clostridia bacterium]